MLSYSQAKELIAEHEAIEKEIVELLNAQEELYKKIEDKGTRLHEIEDKFLPEKEESLKAKLMKGVVVEPPKEEFIAAPAEAPKGEQLKVSPYRIKGDR